MDYQYKDIFLKKLSPSEHDEINSLLRLWGLENKSFYQRLDYWFQNFTDKDKYLVHKLLLNFDYLNPESIDKRIKQLFIPIRRYLKQNNKTEFDILIAISNDNADSSTRSSYDISKLWNITQHQIFTLKNLRRQYLEEKVVVFFNDTHGTGNQFIREIVPHIKDLNCKIFVVCLTITKDAMRNFQSLKLKFTILPNKSVKNAFDVFNSDEIKRIEQLGNAVYPLHPLGYGKQALLTSYYYQCPNNTLPIIWANGKNNKVAGQSLKWNALFEYKPKRGQKALKDYNYKKLIENISALNPAISINEEYGNKLILVEKPLLLEIDQLPNKLTLAIAGNDRIQISKQLEVIYTKYKNEYIKSGNPTLMYNKILLFVNTIEKIFAKKSIQIGKYHWLLSYLLINSDYDNISLEKAGMHARNAIDIFENANLFDKEIHILLIKSHWLNALSHKMQGHLTDAHRMISDVLFELEKEGLGDYFETLYLRRQKVLIENQKDSYEELSKGMTKYGFNEIESYYTSKRLFEFALKSNIQKDFEKYYKISFEHFKKASPFLEQVYKFSYWKYLYIYFKYKNKHRVADRIYNFLLKNVKEKQLWGQLRTLESLKEMFCN